MRKLLHCEQALRRKWAETCDEEEVGRPSLTEVTEQRPRETAEHIWQLLVLCEVSKKTCQVQPKGVILQVTTSFTFLLLSKTEAIRGFGTGLT